MSIEQEVIRIWIHHTKGSKGELSEDFFDVGGSSLGSIHLLVDLNKFFNIELDPNDFFSSPILNHLLELTEKEVNKKI